MDTYVVTVYHCQWVSMGYIYITYMKTVRNTIDDHDIDNDIDW